MPGAGTVDSTRVLSLKMASLLVGESLDSARRIADEDDHLEIHELVVDDMHVVDMLGGQADVVNEVTVLESGSDRTQNTTEDELPSTEEVMLDSAYAYEDPVSSAEPEIELSAEYLSSGIIQGAGRKARVGSKVKKQLGKRLAGTSSCVVDSAEVVPRTVRKWERKQVQIKTLEGEFTVTVWATGMSVSWL